MYICIYYYEQKKSFMKWNRFTIKLKIIKYSTGVCWCFNIYLQIAVNSSLKVVFIIVFKFFEYFEWETNSCTYTG